MKCRIIELDISTEKTWLVYNYFHGQHKYRINSYGMLIRKI